MPSILATDNGGADGVPLNDCYGTATQTAGTVITRVVPPHPTARAIVGAFSYDCGATAHTLTMMQCMQQVSCTTLAESGQAVLPVSAIPTASDGSLAAANDFLIIQYDNGSYAAVQISSISGLNITLTANLSYDVLRGAPIYFMGAPADHTLRQFTMQASKVTTFNAGDYRVRAATSDQAGWPILVHSNNATAQGYLTYLNYYYE